MNARFDVLQDAGHFPQNIQGGRLVERILDGKVWVTSEEEHECQIQ